MHHILSEISERFLLNMNEVNTRVKDESVLNSLEELRVKY